jgi:hypothetical protein
MFMLHLAPWESAHFKAPQEESSESIPHPTAGQKTKTPRCPAAFDTGGKKPLKRLKDSKKMLKFD